MILKSIIALLLLLSIILLVMIGLPPIERKLLFFPTHHPHDNNLTPWVLNGEIIGYSRNVESPKNVWLMLHGNAGQASDRLYAIQSFSDEDSVYILEYPGYGNREGVPSKDSFNRAAKEAYISLRKACLHIPVCVAAESIGSGPASSLASLSQPPDKFVLIVPIDRLNLVAEEHFPSFLVRLMLKDNWDNIEPFSHYKGPVEIFGAESDTIIPVRHAKNLAAAIPGSRLTIINGGHNDWAEKGRVKIRNP
jgi:uncharacterized protein